MIPTATLATWLADNIHHLTQHPDAPQLADNLLEAINNATHTIDRPPDRWYAGTCNHTPNNDTPACTGELYAKTGAHTVTCPTCDATYDTAARRTWLREAVHDVLATTTEISRALTSLDTPVTVDSINGYARRGQLTAHGTDTHGHALYRVGDVITLVTATMARKAKP